MEWKVLHPVKAGIDEQLVLIRSLSIWLPQRAVSKADLGVLVIPGQAEHLSVEPNN